MQSSVRLSVIVPAYNEALLLPRLLDTIDVARARYAAERDAVEMIVADNASTDRTAEIAAARGCRVVPVAPRLIAAVRNGGAAAATGSILAFVDADMQVHPDTFNAIDAALADPSIIGGATGIVPERWSAGIAMVYGLLESFATLSRVDAGVTFCRRQAFFDIGGYDERRSCAEDVDFLLRLKRLGRSRRQRLARLRAAKAVFSTRKFDRYGDWHWLTKIAPVAAAVVRRPQARGAAVRQYWYDDRG